MRATAKRNPNFYRDTWFDEVEINVISDVGARTNALTSGEVDYIDSCDPKTVELLKQNPDIEVDTVTGHGHCIFVMNVTQPPFDNPEVRKALKYAVDRQAIVDKIFRGYARPATTTRSPPVSSSPSIRNRYTNTIRKWPRACSRRLDSSRSRSIYRLRMRHSPERWTPERCSRSWPRPRVSTST